LPSATKIELYDGDVVLELDAKHRYSIDVKGTGPKIAPGVTGISGIVDKSDKLIGWAKKKVIDYIRERLIFQDGRVGIPSHTGVLSKLDEVVLAALFKEAFWADKRSMDNAATIGTQTHEWVERHIKLILDGHGKKLPMPVNQQVANGVRAFLAWEAAHKVEYVFSERQVASVEHWYAGTLDILAVVDGKLMVVDIKTTTGVYQEMFLQTAGYVIALEEEFREPIEGRVIVHLSRDTGAVTPHDVEAEGPGMEADKKGFIACREVFRRIKGL
jgi:hypothetical protein